MHSLRLWEVIVPRHFIRNILVWIYHILQSHIHIHNFTIIMYINAFEYSYSSAIGFHWIQTSVYTMIIFPGFILLVSVILTIVARFYSSLAASPVGSLVSASMILVKNHVLWAPLWNQLWTIFNGTGIRRTLVVGDISSSDHFWICCWQKSNNTRRPAL